MKESRYRHRTSLTLFILTVFCLTGAFMALGGPGIYSDRSKAQAAKQTQVPSGPPTLVPTPTCTPDWSPDADLPSTGVGLVGVYFQANGKFYGMGGRSSDTAGNEFTHPFEYDPNTNTWTTKGATYPDNMVNNIACGVLTDAGTPYIYCAGGSVVSTPTVTTGRVFRYNPVTDTISPVAAPWPAAGTTVIPGGFTVFQNKLYILGGFDTVTGGGQGINQIWEFTPSPAGWVQKPTVLPVPLGYIPTTTIGSLIYTGGGSDITAGALTDTTNSFVYNPVANTIGTIAAIPRATGETRALNFNGLMLVMGGGTAPNPSNEVNIYNPANNTWTVGSPVPSFFTARRNFPTDTDGSTRIWLGGGYASTTTTNTMETFSPCPTRVLVTTVDDHNDGVCDATDCTLREAITAVNANAGRIIAFAPGVTGTIQLAAALPSLNTNMAIQGPGANLLTVRRNIGGSYRIFNISANNVIISGLTIANGNSPSNGGGISSTGGLTIANCTISGHTTGSSGGGIVSSHTLSIVNSTISGNSATNGFGGGIYNTGTAEITNSTISGNSVSELSLGIGSGGGIQNSGGGVVSITNSTISGNTAQFRGGGINSSGTLRSRNTIIALNTAPSGPDVFGTLTSDNFNLIGNNSGVTITPAQLSDQIGTPGSPINPLLGPLQNNGGATLTRALLSGSPATDKGHSSGLATDQRGFVRTFNDPAIPNAIGGDGTDIGAFELFAPFAVSRKLHGAAMFDIALPLTGPAGIECRNGNVSGDHQVILTFPSLVTVASASVTTGTGSVSGFTVNGGQVTINLTGVANVQTIITTLFGVNNGTTTSDVTVPMGVLLGDTNGNGSVSASDIGQTKAQSGQPATGSNFRTDVNVNGSISAADIGLVKSKSGTSLPP